MIDVGREIEINQTLQWLLRLFVVCQLLLPTICQNYCFFLFAFHILKYKGIKVQVPIWILNKYTVI